MVKVGKRTRIEDWMKLIQERTFKDKERKIVCIHDEYSMKWIKVSSLLFLPNFVFNLFLIFL
jgi:hypothetical protein